MIINKKHYIKRVPGVSCICGPSFLENTRSLIPEGESWKESFTRRLLWLVFLLDDGFHPLRQLEIVSDLPGQSLHRLTIINNNIILKEYLLLLVLDP